MEYGAFLSAMTTKTNAAGYFMNNGHTNPTATHPQELLHQGGLESVAMVRSRIDEKIDEMYRTPDEEKRQAR